MEYRFNVCEEGNGMCVYALCSMGVEIVCTCFHLCIVHVAKFIQQGESKKSVISKTMAITPLKSIEREKVGVFRKIQHKCCRIGTKPFNISGEMRLATPLENG